MPPDKTRSGAKFATCANQLKINVWNARPPTAPTLPLLAGLRQVPLAALSEKVNVFFGYEEEPYHDRGCGQGKSGGPHQFHLRPADVLPARLADLGTFGKGWTTVWLACARRPADSTLGPLTPQGVRHVPFLAQLNTTYAIPSV